MEALRAQRNEVLPKNQTEGTNWNENEQAEYILSKGLLNSFTYSKWAVTSDSAV